MMTPIKLISGREVSLTRFDIEDIYAGVLEGTPEMVAKFQRRTLPERVKQRFWDSTPLLIVDAQAPTLPQYRCIAHFRSAPVQPGYYYSGLIVCWFVDDLNSRIPVMAKQILDAVDWAAHAADTHVDDL